MVKFRVTYEPPENPKERVLIDIPFNLWQEFGKKGMLEVDLTINGVQMPNVGLLPRGNGMYSIKFTKQLQSKVKANPLDQLDITIKLTEHPQQKKPEVKKEYRKIQQVMLVKQSNDRNCGQACVAMLTGGSIEDVCKVMNTNGSTSIGQIIEALDVYGIKHAEKNVRLSKKNPNIPEIAILTVHFPEYSHWVVYYKGTYFDPEFGQSEEYTRGKITSFLECFEN